MRPHTKFRANRSIYREVITFRIFSRWLPSAILNFEKFKFLIIFRGRSRNLRRHTKFGLNRMIGGRDIAIKPKSKMAVAAMLNLLPVYILTRFARLGRQNASAYQISCKSVNIWRSYNVSSIFKMAAAEVTWHHYLQFWTTHEVAEVVRTCCSNLISESWLLLDISSSLNETKQNSIANIRCSFYVVKWSNVGDLSTTSSRKETKYFPYARCSIISEPLTSLWCSLAIWKIIYHVVWEEVC